MRAHKALERICRKRLHTDILILFIAVYYLSKLACLMDRTSFRKIKITFFISSLTPLSERQPKSSIAITKAQIVALVVMSL